MNDHFHVTAEPGDAVWVLQCTEHPGAMTQVEDLTDPFILREAIALVAEQADDTFLIDFKAKTESLSLTAIQWSEKECALYTANILPNKKRLGRPALAEWVLGVLHANCSDAQPEPGILGILSSDEVDPESVMGATFHLFFDSGRNMSFPRVGNKRISDILSVVPDAAALTAWLLDQGPNYYSSSGELGRLSSVQVNISSHRTRNAPAPVEKQQKSQRRRWGQSGLVPRS